MDLLQQFTRHIGQEHLFRPSDRLLIAVSGGLDSVVLCELCHRASYPFGMAHGNFQLRGAESDGDEQFVRTLADQYQVPVMVKLFETSRYARENKCSIQVAARELRYRWFAELLQSGYQWLLTAHHADDNIETMVMNFFRGTGLAGLRGILPKAGNIIRPLLPFSRRELAAFATRNGLTWREDSSNQEDKYSRNYFRHTIIPDIRSVFPAVEDNLKDNARRLRETEELYMQAVAAHKKRLLETSGSEIRMAVLKLKQSSPVHTIVFEIVRDYGFSANQVQEVVRLLDAPHGKFVQSSSHRIIRNRNWLVIAANEAPPDSLVIIDKGQQSVSGGLLTIGSSEANIEVHTADPLRAYLDSRELDYPLILRKWKPGDYFYPLGMRKKKKVSRFLIDLKLSPTQKERILVLESQKRICWVVGLRIDDRFRITPHTRGITVLRFSGYPS